MSLNNKTVFLAGSTGMAGASILQSILKDYPLAKIRASYHKTQPFIKDKRISYVQGDAKSLSDSRRMVKGCDLAIMAAAYTGGAGFTNSQPWDYLKENLLINTQLLEAFNLEEVQKIIYIGSATLYQEYMGKIKEEELDLNQEPHLAYLGFGWVVRFSEKLCKILHQRYGREVIMIRAANIFGPYAKFDPRFSNFIPALIRKATEKMDPFEVWGSPGVVRDVIYAEDFARAVSSLADNDKIKFDVFNVGSGVKTSVAEAVKWVLKYVGHKPRQLRYLANQPATTKFRLLDCAKIRKQIGWKPEYSVEEGIEKTCLWWQKNKGWWRK